MSPDLLELWRWIDQEIEDAGQELDAMDTNDKYRRDLDGYMSGLFAVHEQIARITNPKQTRS